MIVGKKVNRDSNGEEDVHTRLLQKWAEKHANVVNSTPRGSIMVNDSINKQKKPSKRRFSGKQYGNVLDELKDPVKDPA